MSQSISTPRSRRGVPPETPGSARSNTSFASTTIDRATLEDRIEDLELETHDLKRQIAAERERRPLSLSYMDPMGKDANGIKQVLLSRLKKMDDEALTRLLTASSDGLVGFIASAKSSNGENFADADNEAGEGLTVYSVLDASLVPSKSVGVEGLGSASDIDRRLLDYNSGKTSSSSKDLVRDHVRNWERENGLDFAPYHPPNSNYGTTSSSSTFRKKTASTDDESLARSLILPEQAESLILTNKNKASLTIRFAIMWNRFGHAIPSITAIPWIPEALLNPTVQTFLDGFQDEFQHLIKTALAQDGMIGLPDQDQDDEDEDEDGLDGIVGRFGILPGLHAVIKAFFGLENNHLSIEQDSSLEQE
uniref:Uncharacterized protein n=1 Tax=Melanopsichium pennsylvanicum 4 TaxID=1398559 RepID=A0A077QPV7_9BASI|nr:hypothetical protein BN887_02079 [Melanopsichium pennsylvanicum 4]